MTTQIETAEHQIVLVERRIPYSLVDLFTLLHEAVVPISPGKASLDPGHSRRPPAAGALK